MDRRRDPVYSVYTNIGASGHPPQPQELRAIEPSHPVVVATTERHPDPPPHWLPARGEVGGKRVEARGGRQAEPLIDQRGDCPGAAEQPEDINISHPLRGGS